MRDTSVHELSSSSRGRMILPSTHILLATGQFTITAINPKTEKPETKARQNKPGRPSDLQPEPPYVHQTERVQASPFIYPSCGFTCCAGGKLLPFVHPPHGSLQIVVPFVRSALCETGMNRQRRIRLMAQPTYLDTYLRRPADGLFYPTSDRPDADARPFSQTSQALPESRACTIASRALVTIRWYGARNSGNTATVFSQHLQRIRLILIWRLRSCPSTTMSVAMPLCLCCGVKKS
jgi:hypothetical protein